MRAGLILGLRSTRLPRRKRRPLAFQEINECTRFYGQVATGHMDQIQGTACRASDGVIGQNTLQCFACKIFCDRKSWQQGIASSTLVQVFSDNSMLVEQLGGHPKAPIDRLATLFDEAREALRQFPQAHVQWIPRHRNGAADTLARAALGLAPKASKPQGQTIKKRGRR